MHTLYNLEYLRIDNKVIKEDMHTISYTELLIYSVLMKMRLLVTCHGTQVESFDFLLLHPPQVNK